MAEMASPSKPKKKDGFDEWEIDSAVRTLREVGKILGDEKLLKLAEEKLHEESKGIRSVQDLKKAYERLVNGEMPRKAGIKAPMSDKAADEDNLPATSKFKSYKQAKADNDDTSDGDLEE